MRKKLITLTFIHLFILLILSLPALPQDKSATLNALIMQSSIEYKKGDFDKAIKLLEKAKEVDPASPVPPALLSDLYRSRSQFDKAAIECEIALKIDTESAGLHRKLGVLYLNEAEHIENAAESAGVLTEKSKIARQKAADTLEKSLNYKFIKDNERYRKETFKMLADNYSVLKQNDKVIETLDRWKEVDPNEPAIFFYKGDVYLSQKEFEKAVEEFENVKNSPVATKGLKEKAEKQIEEIENARKMQLKTYAKYGGIGLAVLILVLIIILVILKARPRKKEPWQKKQQDKPEEEDGLEDLNTYEGICKMAIRKLLHLTQMPYGIIFLPGEDETTLEPKVSFGLDRDVENLEYSAVDAREWIIEREGQPFVFRLERREVPFCRAFPDSSEILGEHDMRIGVPLIAKNRMIGIGYFGCPESKQKKKFRKLYEQNKPLIEKVSGEISEVLDDLISRKQAITDPVTGLYNHSYFEERLPKMIDEARNKSKTCSLIMLSLDGYKDLMETFGEDYGEKLIKMGAIALSTAISGTNSILCRIKETTFGIVYPEAPLDMATEMTEKIKEEISSVKIARHIPPATASIGVGTFPATAIYAEKLEELVSDALEKAQSDGGNRIQVAEKKLRTMETTKMTRDQVLAAVERRRQVRKAMQTGSEAAEEDTPQDMAPPPVKPIQAEPSSTAPAGQQQFPRGYTEREPASPVARQPAAPIVFDNERQREEAQTPLTPSTEAAQQQKGRRPLSILPKTEGASRETAKSQSPFARRTALPSEDMADESMEEASARDQTYGTPPRQRDVESQPPGAKAKLNINVEEGRQESLQHRLAPASPVKGGGPAGPLDFQKEMDTIRQKESESQPELQPGKQIPIPGKGAAFHPQQQADGGVGARQPAMPARPQTAPAKASSSHAPSSSGAVSTDPLTGFYHRSSFEKALLGEAQKLKGASGECTLLYFGLDNFEKMKGKYGSPKLRQVIKVVAEKLKAPINESRGIPGRIEENGFALFLPNTGLKAGSELAARMRLLIHNLTLGEFGKSVTLSFGVSSYPQIVKSFREIVISSRKAMEKAMKSGGNLVEIGVKK